MLAITVGALVGLTQTWLSTNNEQYAMGHISQPLMVPAGLDLQAESATFPQTIYNLDYWPPLHKPH